MISFEIHLNGEKKCIAGFSGDGVLTVFLTCSRTSYYPKGVIHEETRLDVTGLDSEHNKHVKWLQQRELRAGDEVVLRIVDSQNIDAPLSPEKICPPEEDVERQKAFVTHMAEKFGWKIVM